jgi:DinB superfamily
METNSNPRSKLLLEQFQFMLAWVNMYLDALTDEELRSEIVPGKNHGLWILGHLVASDDTLSEYLGCGPTLFPETQAYAQGQPLLPVDECKAPGILREEWKKVCQKNKAIYQRLTDAELDQPHALLQEYPENDYFKTKQGVLLNWPLHQAHHAGQLALLLAKHGRRLA